MIIDITIAILSVNELQQKRDKVRKKGLKELHGRAGAGVLVGGRLQ